MRKGDVEPVMPHMAFADEGVCKTGAEGVDDFVCGEVVVEDVGGSGVE